MAKPDIDKEIKEKQNIERKNRITHKVLKELGKPPGLVSVDITIINEMAYRVNVIVRDCNKADVIDIINRRIAHSFFVIEKNQDSQIKSDPIISKIYKN